MAYYKQSETLADMAAALIADHYPEIKKYEIKICYLFKKEIPHAAGVCRKVDDLNRALHGYDFVITIAEDLWNEAGKKGDDTFQKALMDHELAHVAIVYDEESGEPKYDQDSGMIRTALNRHNVEEFESIIERYGTYAGDLRRFIAAFERNKARKVEETAPGGPIGDTDSRPWQLGAMPEESEG